MKKTFQQLLPKQNITLTNAQLDTLERFGKALLEKNQVMNLTAITEPSMVAELHFYDCLSRGLSGRSVKNRGAFD